MEIIELPNVMVAGLAVRTNNENEQDPEKGWLMKTWERASKKQYKGSIAAVLTDYENASRGFYTEVIGHEITSANELKPGEVLVRVPEGKYAKFVTKGKMPGIVLETWKKVWQAEAEKSIKRSYTAVLERYPDHETVEIFISVK